MNRIVLLLLGLLMVISFVGCSDSNLNKPDTNLEFWIAENVDNVDFSKYQERYGMFGGSEYYGTGYTPTKDENGQHVDPEHCVIYTVTAYPDYASNKSCITRIYISDPSVEIYGLSLNTPIEDIEAKMSSEGFEIEKTAGGLIAARGKFSISFSEKSINLRVEVSNVFGIQF